MIGIIAIALLILWVLLKLGFGIATGLIHLLLIAGVILAVIYIVQAFTGSRSV